MPSQIIRLFSVIVLLLPLLTGCGGPGGVRITEGEDAVSAAPTGRAPQAGDATIVHVNQSDRLATIRNGSGFSASTFLKTVDRSGEQTGYLKTRAQRPRGLRTADILEGSPRINNRAVPVDAAERSRLENLYPDLDDGSF